MQEADGSGKAQSSYVYGLDLISRLDERNKPGYYLYDGLGSVIGLTNSHGSLTTKYSYDEWGVPDHHSRFGQGEGKANTYGFTGEQWDQDTGLLYLRARYYQPEVGRFVSRDPFGGFLNVSQSLNRYIYCRNNPVNFVDPSGNIPVMTIVKVVLTIAAIYGSYKTYQLLTEWDAVVEKGIQISKSGKYPTEAERLHALTRTEEWKRFNKDFPSVAAFLYERGLLAGVRL